MKPSEIATSFRLEPGLFLLDLEVASQEELFASLVDALVAARAVLDRDALLRLLVEREALGTTGLGHGVAIPHARSMVARRTSLVCARLARELDFGAVDGAPVRLVYLVVAPYGAGGEGYLPLLGVLVAALHRDADRERLLTVESFADLEKLARQLIRPRIQEALAR
ncbi:MAG TPA: PTS sugar transporter subunit IIA [Thermoanaerobaculia bacterium]|nr:PTS sugar transporter subunit IIA [Thermoanaerobaculia bacterium]